MNPEIQALTQRVQMLESIINEFKRPDRYSFPRTIELTDRANINISGVNGTKVGSSTSKIGFYGVTPVVRQAAVTNPTGGGTGITDAIDIQARASINQIRTDLTNLGLTN